MKSSNTKTASPFFIGMREGAEKRAYGLQLGGAALGAFAGAKARHKKRYDENLADYSAMVHGMMTPEQFMERRSARRRQGLVDTAAGAATGALGGHLLKTRVIPKIQHGYGTAKKEIVDLAGEAGRKAVESAREPAKDIARQVAREVVNEGEERIKHNLGKVNVGDIAEQAGSGLRKGLTPSVFRSDPAKAKGGGVFSSLKRFLREE